MKIFNTTFSITILLFLLISFGCITVLLFLPLTNIIGYEFSLFTAIILFLFFGLAVIHKKRTDSIEGHNLYLAVLIVFIPFLVAAFNTVFNSRCPLNESMLFYLLITIPAAYFGFVAGLYSFILSRRYSYILFIIITLVLIIVPILEIYFYPQIYFYNPIVTFFPGTIYDENITIDSKMFLYRITTIMFFILLHVLINYIIKSGQVKSKRYLIIAPPIMFLLFIFLKPQFGFATSSSALRNVLKKEVITSNIKTNCSDSLNKLLLDRLILDQEYYYEKIEKVLGFSPHQRINSFVFRNREQKGNLFGAENADVAKPWLYEIYIEEQTSGSTIKHELVHAFTGEIGVTPFKVAENFNPAMIEGLAMAVENNYAGYDPHYLAYIAANSNFKVPLQTIFTGLNFFGNVSSISYIYSGSFLKFLGEKYGFDKVILLYTDINFEKYFGKSLDQLEEMYHDFLQTKDYPFNQSTAELFFGRKPITKKFCPREAARQMAKANKLFANRNYIESAKLYHDIYKYSSSFHALRGLIYSQINLDKLNEADSVLSIEIKNFEGTSYYFNLELIAGDLKTNIRDSISACNYYNSVITKNPSYAYYAAAKVRDKFLRISLEELVNYLDADRKNKLKQLNSLNTDTLFYESIPTLLEYSVDEEINPCEVIDNYYHRFEVFDLNSAMAAKEFSEYLTYYGFYSEAKELAEKSLRLADSRYLEVWRENLEKIVWFSKFASEILNNAKYIEHN